ncbi:MAG: hypothetical protein GXO27_02405, partial [Chlorobi bacterium]|nr:hypothetical protein [Chlorobiota bacterium]
MPREEKITGQIKPLDQRTEILRRYFPEYFDKDGRFDADKFKADLTEAKVDLSTESYSLE